MRFEIIAVFAVRLWDASSCSIQDVGHEDVYNFLRMKPFPRLSVAVGISSRDRSLLFRRLGAHSLIQR